jgi:hypothetical protein
MRGNTTEEIIEVEGLEANVNTSTINRFRCAGRR